MSVLQPAPEVTRAEEDNMRYELIVIWWDTTQDSYQYETLEEARSAMRGMETAFGGQIQYMFVTEVR